MSTILISNNKIEAVIVDVCKFGDTHHKCLTTGRIYLSERVAIKRALVRYRKKYGIKPGISRKRRKFKTIRTRRKPVPPVKIELPLISTVYQDMERKYFVHQTGKLFKEDEYDKAVINAIEYQKKYNNGTLS